MVPSIYGWTLGEVDHGFDDAGGGCKPLFETLRDFIDHRVVGDPRIRVDRSIFDQGDNAAEVARWSIATGKNR